MKGVPRVMLIDAPVPSLRPLDMFPTENRGEPVVVLRDPEGICENTLSLPLPAYFIVSCFNGENTPAAIQGAFQRRFGQRVRVEDIESLARQLDGYFLLQTETYRARRRHLEDAYAALPARPASHAGQAYPDSAEALKAVFEAFFTLRGGAGPIERAAAPRRR
ncbi:MAG: hypothetical protein NTW86_23040, partial [Candidatus Sumerlaeota bacterium]|nr:hypothetical protein [Candidatus Sumerlaeota bacterium]